MVNSTVMYESMHDSRDDSRYDARWCSPRICLLINVCRVLGMVLWTVAGMIPYKGIHE